MPNEKMTLSNLSNGAVVERAEWELQKILANIADPNTDPTKKRELTIKITIKPDETREISDVEITCTSKLASIKPLKTRMFMSEDKDGRFFAQELIKDQIVGQISIEDDDVSSENNKIRKLERKVE